jgi:hypothetical protein
MTTSATPITSEPPANKPNLHADEPSSTSGAFASQLNTAASIPSSVTNPLSHNHQNDPPNHPSDPFSDSLTQSISPSPSQRPVSPDPIPQKPDLISPPNPAKPEGDSPDNPKPSYLTIGQVGGLDLQATAGASQLVVGSETFALTIGGLVTVSDNVIVLNPTDVLIQKPGGGVDNVAIPTPPPVPFLPGPIVTVDKTPVVVNSNGDVVVGDKTLSNGGSPIIIGDKTIGLAPNGIVVADPTKTNTFVAASSQSNVQEPFAIFTASGMVYTVDPFHHVVVQGSTLSEGGSAVTLPNGEIISIGATGVELVSGSTHNTIPFALPLAAVTIDGSIYTADSAGHLVYHESTYTAGGAPLTLPGGQTISVAPHGLVVMDGSITYTATYSAAIAAVTLDGTTYTLDSSTHLVIDHSTLSVGSPAMTLIDGEIVSLSSNGIVVVNRQSTYTVPYSYTAARWEVYGTNTVTPAINEAQSTPAPQSGITGLSTQSLLTGEAGGNFAQASHTSTSSAWKIHAGGKSLIVCACAITLFLLFS